MKTSIQHEAIPVQEASPLPIGSVAPYFSGLDQHGKFQSIDRLIKKGPIVIIFYRGEWCFFCKKHTSNFQRGLDKLSDNGFPVVLVTPEKPKYISKAVEKYDIKFPVIYDNYNYIMNNYKVARPASNKALTASLSMVDLRKRNDTENPVLPVPATYIIGTDGLIKYAHFNINYAFRSSFKKVAEKVNELRVVLA